MQMLHPKWRPFQWKPLHLIDKFVPKQQPVDRFEKILCFEYHVTWLAQQVPPVGLVGQNAGNLFLEKISFYGSWTDRLAKRKFSWFRNLKIIFFFFFYKNHKQPITRSAWLRSLIKRSQRGFPATWFFFCCCCCCDDMRTTFTIFSGINYNFTNFVLKIIFDNVAACD